MGQQSGVWIDHKKAVIVTTTVSGVSVLTVESEVGPHTHFSSSGAHATPDGPHVGGGEKKYEDRYAQHLDRYFDEVITLLGQPKALLIFGPGEAKLQFRERLTRSKTLSGRVVGVETTDKLTDPQIVAKVKGHFGLGR